MPAATTVSEPFFFGAPPTLPPIADAIPTTEELPSRDTLHSRCAERAAATAHVSPEVAQLNGTMLDRMRRYSKERGLLQALGDAAPQEDDDTFQLTALGSLPELEGISWTSVGQPRNQPRERRGSKRMPPLPRCALPGQKRSASPVEDPGLEEAGKPAAARASTPFGLSSKLGQRAATAHEYLTLRLNRLREDDDERHAFQDAIRARWRVQADERQQVQERMLETLRSVSRGQSPSSRRLRQEELSVGRRAHSKSVELRREEAEATRLEHKQHLVAVAYKERITIRDLNNRKRREELRASKLLGMVTAFAHVTRVGMEAVKGARSQPKHSHALESAMDGLLRIPGAVRAAIVLQKVWRGVRAQLAGKKRLASLKALRAFFRLLHPIKVKFRIALHRLREHILLLQRRWRAVLLCRQRRRDLAMVLVRDAVQELIRHKQARFDHHVRRRHHLERQRALAIKARRPLFDSQIEETQHAIQQATRDQDALQLLRPADYELMAHDPVVLRENAYDELLLQYGIELARRRLDLERKARRAAKARRSLNPSGDFSEWEFSSRLGRHRRVGRPVMCLCLLPEEAKAIAAVRGQAIGMLRYRRDQLRMEESGMDAELHARAEIVLPPLHQRPSSGSSRYIATPPAV